MEVRVEMDKMGLVIANEKLLQEGEAMVAGLSTQLARYNAGPSRLANDQTQYPIKPSFSENTACNGSLSDILLPYHNVMLPVLNAPAGQPAHSRRPPMHKGTPSYRARHIYTERKRRKDMTFLFDKLKSLLPTLQHHDLKVDRCTIVTHVIDYVQELNKKVQALEKMKARLLVLGKKTHNNKGSMVQEDNKKMPFSFSKVSVRLCGPTDIFISLNCPKKQGLWPNLMALLQDKLQLHIQSNTFCSTPLFCIHSIYVKVLDDINNDFWCEKLQEILSNFIATQSVMISSYLLQ